MTSQEFDTMHFYKGMRFVYSSDEKAFNGIYTLVNVDFEKYIIGLRNEVGGHYYLPMAYLTLLNEREK